ncbi:MAG: TerD family protein [SAR324 cluster bacterium]|nr:TerD family protein [SAR324 cluster bacterium]
MGINLVKGQKVDMGLSRVKVGLGWDPQNSGSVDFDLDASVFMLNASKKIPREEFFVYYNNLTSPDGSLQHGGDNLSGQGEGDDEVINLDMDKVDNQVQEIIFVVSIHEAVMRKQNFGQVRNSFIRICDEATNEEICKYELGEDFSIETCIEFGRLYKRNNQWRFEGLGTGFNGGLQELVDKYT